MSGALGLGLALALPAAAAWLVLGVLLPEPPGGRDGWAALAGRAAAAVLLGLGVPSLLSFGWLLCGGTLGRAYAAADAVVFAAIALFAWRAWRRRVVTDPAGAPEVAEHGGRERLRTAAAAALLVALALCAIACIRAALVLPHGEWDAWSIWNLRARFLFRGGGAWRDAFSHDLTWSQPGYPLLLPLAVARAWAYAGETLTGPAVVAALFTLATPVAVFAAVARRAGAVPAAVAALLLLATPGYLRYGAARYADVPMAALLVAGLAAIGEARDREGTARARWLACAGLLLGLAGWTKNEGIAAAACAVAAHVAVGPGPRTQRLTDLGWVAAGAALPAAAWLLFHGLLVSTVAPDFTAPPGAPGPLARLAAPGRLGVVLPALWARFPGRAESLPLVAPALAVLLGVRVRRMARSVPLVAAALLLGVDVLAYLGSPRELAWHIGTSAERVLLQPWPALLLGLFAAAAPPAVNAPETSARAPASPCSRTTAGPA